jgi:GT2 family glycosyltransferase
MLLRCLQSIRDLTDVACLPIVVCDGCVDGTEEEVHSRFPEAVVVKGDGNMWWSGAINAGIEVSVSLGAQYICLLNDDVKPAPDMLAALLRGSKEHPRALIGAFVFDVKNPHVIWGAGGAVDWWRSGLLMRDNELNVSPELLKPKQVDWLPGMGTLIPVEVLEQTGKIDAKTFPQYFGDADFCLRAGRKGVAIWVWPEAKLYNDVESTGYLLPQGAITWKTAVNILCSLRSHSHWVTRLRFWMRHCPPLLIPWQVFRFYGPLLAIIAKKLTLDRLVASIAHRAS